MSNTAIIQVPDIGDFKNVEVIEVLISPGERIGIDTPLISVESDKATMEVPSPRAGLVKNLRVAVGDRVSQGSPIVTLEIDTDTDADDDNDDDASSFETSVSSPDPAPADSAPVAGEVSLASGEPSIAAAKASHPSPTQGPSADLRTQVLVLGGGPGGYTAAFRAADLGKTTLLVERYPALGGVCLHVGCIPSKACLHAANILEEAKGLAAHGITFAKPTIELTRLANWKDRLVGRLAKGIAALAKQRKVRVLQGNGEFSSPNVLTAHTDTGPVTIAFEHAIIAAGSHTAQIPGLPRDPRIWTSTRALQLPAIPPRLLIIGGGVIGLEMATLYHALGSRITIAEFQDALIPGCDRDLVRVLRKHIDKRYENIFLQTAVTGIRAREDGLHVSFHGPKAPDDDRFDAVLVAVGRTPNGKRIGAEALGIQVDETGFLSVDRQQRTNLPHIFAIGDIVGQPMLAHKALHQGKAAAEAIAGLPAEFDPIAIPTVAYTDPEIAWAGLSEDEARARGIDYDKGAFPWAASGRALGLGGDQGISKLLFQKETHRIIGAGIAGPRAGELIAEAVLAMEMGADFHDMGLTIHPHPTLSETLGLSAEMVAGTITDLMPR
uniref:Dihydrolipoyl dehydrogenase n=1 Tax=Candidatus Kentrum sp. MB TaxID=2138164 RepID=A0A450XCX1_9GAMM|nr:MAG: dihydrolipoamide dehydrogenase [Candidatus Kentron sp. MB]